MSSPTAVIGSGKRRGCRETAATVRTGRWGTEADLSPGSVAGPVVRRGAYPALRDRPRHRPGHREHGLRRDRVRRPRLARARAGHGAHRAARGARAAPGRHPARDPGADRRARARRRRLREPLHRRQPAHDHVGLPGARCRARGLRRRTGSPAPSTRRRRSRPTVCGFGGAGKDQVMRMVRQLLSLRGSRPTAITRPMRSRSPSATPGAPAPRSASRAPGRRGDRKRRGAAARGRRRRPRGRGRRRRAARPRLGRGRARWRRSSRRP